MQASIHKATLAQLTKRLPRGVLNIRIGEK